MVMLMEQVQSMKGIPISRMRVVLPPDRKIEGAKLEFTLKRLGIFENSEVQILPTTPRSWLWHPYDWCPTGTRIRQYGRA